MQKIYGLAAGAPRRGKNGTTVNPALDKMSS